MPLMYMSSGSDSLIVFRSSDADDFCYSGETEVADLYIQALGTDPLDLSCIESITGDLEIGDSVVTVGLNNLSSGRKVRVLDD